MRRLINCNVILGGIWLLIIIQMLGTPLEVNAAEQLNKIASSGYWEGNEGENDYPTYGYTVKENLVSVDGYLLRVKSVNDSSRVVVEYYNTSYQLVKSLSLNTELPIFGGFYATSTNFYIISGQLNNTEDDNVEVYRVTKYDKNWKALGHAGIFGGETTVPFEAGSCRVAQCGDYLVVRTCHRRYAENGVNHQTNVTIEVDTRNMTISEESANMPYASSGFVSHSFNQYVEIDNNRIIAVDHGDGHPRSVVLNVFNTDCSQGKFLSTGRYDKCDAYDLLKFPGSQGFNYTGASVGGLEVTDTSYIVVGNNDVDFSRIGVSTRNIFISVFNKASKTFATRYLTNYPDGHISATTPYLVEINNNKYMVIWTEGDNIVYTYVDKNGDQISQLRSMPGKLSDCKPIYSNGKVIWNVCEYNNSQKVFNFYELLEGRDDGLYAGNDGAVYLYQNGEIATYYSGLYNDAKLGCWLVVNGRVAFEYNDLYCDSMYGWCKIAGGALDIAYTDLYCSPTYGWWKVTGGMLDLAYTDLYCSPMYGWWKVTGGMLDLAYTDLYCSPTYGWWKINGGALDITYNDLYCSPTLGWWKVTGGMLDLAYTDLYCSPTLGWWKIYGGTLDFTYNDIYLSPTMGYWIVRGGTIEFTYDDIFCSPSIGFWKVKNGTIDFAYNGIFTSPTLGFWKCQGGTIDFAYVGLFDDPVLGCWYIRSGTIDFSAKGTYFYNGIIYSVVGGYGKPVILRSAPGDDTEYWGEYEIAPEPLNEEAEPFENNTDSMYKYELEHGM